MFGPKVGPNAKRGNLSKETEKFLAGTRSSRQHWQSKEPKNTKMR
jgi:hypothetical protein